MSERNRWSWKAHCRFLNQYETIPNSPRERLFQMEKVVRTHTISDEKEKQMLLQYEQMKFPRTHKMPIE